MRQSNEIFHSFGIRALAVARTVSNGRWKMVGLLTFLDPLRPDTSATQENMASL